MNDILRNIIKKITRPFSDAWRYLVIFAIKVTSWFVKDFRKKTCSEKDTYSLICVNFKVQNNYTRHVKILADHVHKYQVHCKACICNFVSQRIYIILVISKFQVFLNIFIFQ